ncbi:regulator of G- signaling [Fusarium albosuccineum]|uniref:Regulator of G- signaling n=1 Tax=Fusarium albosuccineum TaxID=1237068 RepID=A0A8H4KKJ6_9HYPO|nr:regulator of G- signaling [Fusarium albosuccineum]
MGLSRSRRQSPECLSPSLPPPSPQPSSAFEDFFDVDSPPSRPMSEAFMSGTSTPNGALGSRPPSLTEILLDVASPPWTLSAFMAYLSQNHCMESLEFTLDSQRYAAFYNEMITDTSNRTQESQDRVCVLWEKLMQVYIIPCAPREVNIPARIRDQLLNLPCGPTPPHPAQLDEAGRILYELMNDSLLVPFLQSVTPMQLDGPSNEGMRGSRRSSNSNSHMGAPVRSMNSMHHIEPDTLTDDSDCNSPRGTEPMTPPTTPPTSEWTFNTSPGGLQRAVVSLPESPNYVDCTDEDLQETHGSGGSYPGHPLPDPIQADDGWNRNPDLRQDGGSRDGTAARPDTARSGGNSSLVQKNIRMRRRIPKTSDPMDCLQSTSSTSTSRSQEPNSPVTYYHSGPLLASLSATSLATDSDHDNLDLCSTPLSDVSNYLPTPAQSSEDMDYPVTTSDNRAFRYASPMEDMYGWDAELDRRKFPPSRSSMSSREDLDTIALSYRRANGSKASLLQRVFRVGSSSSMGKYETAI